MKLGAYSSHISRADLTANNSIYFVFQGDNSVMSLTVEGHDDVFEVSPRVVTRRGKFVISVKNNKKLDYEKVTCNTQYHLRPVIMAAAPFITALCI